MEEIFIDRGSRPIGRLTQCGANLHDGLMTTITFLGEGQDIIDPDFTEVVKCSVA